MKKNSPYELFSPTYPHPYPQLHTTTVFFRDIMPNFLDDFTCNIFATKTKCKGDSNRNSENKSFDDNLDQAWSNSEMNKRCKNCKNPNSPSSNAAQEVS